MRARRLLPGLVALVLACVPAAGARAANPVLPGDFPDPSVVQFGGGYVATATTNHWAPVFPVLTSTDLVSWQQAGSVFERPPRWARGLRFWAPEVSVVHGRLVVLFAGLRRTGQWCIGAATAPAPEGPWRDRGIVRCPPGGAIDPHLVQDDDGSTHLVFKVKGVGGPLHVTPLDPVRLRAGGPSVELLAPAAGDRGVTEGPALLRADGWWYLFHARGTCCRPPCSYQEWVARSRGLTGPYELAAAPLLTSGDEWRCPGHGTPVRGPGGDLFLLHHGYRYGDEANRRRHGLITHLRIEDGWPQAPDGTGGLGALTASAAGAGDHPATPDVLVDHFRGRRPAPGWQWVARSERADVQVRRRRLELGCATHPTVTRQVAQDSFHAAVTVDPGPRRRGPAGLLVRDRDGRLRGVEIRDGAARAVRRRGTRLLWSGRPVRVPRARPARLRLRTGADGWLATDVRSGRGAWREVPAGRAAAGRPPTRVALGCAGGAGTARFATLRVIAPEGPIGPRPAPAG